jgi:hypothetical protein
MKAIPLAPSYTKIDMAALEKNTDWKDPSKGSNLLKALQTTLDQSKKRTDFLTACEGAAAERVKIMQDGAVAAKANKQSPAEINDDTKLKAVRDDLKKIMIIVDNSEKTYSPAMADFRNRSNFDFAGNFKDAVKQLRGQTQERDKKVAAIPAKLKALEGFSSGLIKQIRERRGTMTDNTVRLKKIEAAKNKALGFKPEALTALDKVDSAIREIKKEVGKANASNDMKGKLQDLKNQNMRFSHAMGAIITLRKGIVLMRKGFTGIGFDGSSKPHLDAVEAVEKEIMKKRGEVAKNLAAIRNEKQLPDEIKSGLPAQL